MIPVILILLFVCVILLGSAVHQLRKLIEMNTKAISSLIDANVATMEYTRQVARFVGLLPKTQKQSDQTV